MWKLKLDDGVWLADGAVTTTEEDARLFFDMRAVQEQLKKVRRFVPYPDVVVIYDDGTVPPTGALSG